MVPGNSWNSNMVSVLQEVLEQLPEPPAEESTLAALKRLQDLGALDEKDVRDWISFLLIFVDFKQENPPCRLPLWNVILLFPYDNVETLLNSQSWLYISFIVITAIN